MANETPNRVHAGGLFAPTEPIVAPFTQAIVNQQGVLSFERLGVGRYRIALQRMLAFHEGYADVTLPANLQATAGAQLSADGASVLITVLSLGTGVPVDPPIIACTVWSVREGEGVGPALPFAPSPPPIPAGFTNVLWADPNSPAEPPDQNGSMFLPFGTIEQAANAVPVGTAAVNNATAIIMSGGTFPEGFTVEGKCKLAIANKQIALYGLGRWQLGTFESKVDVDVTADTDDAIPTAFSILAYENGSDGRGGNFSKGLVPTIFGKLNYDVTGNFNVRGSFSCDFSTDESGASIVATPASKLALLFNRSHIAGSIAGDEIDILGAERTRFQGAVQIERCRRASLCEMDSNWTVTGAALSGRVQGFINSHWGPGITFSGPIGSFVVDAYTNYYANQNAVALAGGATKVLINDVSP